MTDTQKRAKDVIRSAEKAIAKIADPAVRAKAAAKLKATEKKIDQARSTSAKVNRNPDRGRDRDFER